MPIYFFNEGESEQMQLLRVVELLDVNVSMHARMIFPGGVCVRWGGGGGIVLSDEKTSTCNRIRCVIGCTKYVLQSNFYIDFLLEKIRAFKKLEKSCMLTRLTCI